MFCGIDAPHHENSYLYLQNFACFSLLFHLYCKEKPLIHFATHECHCLHHCHHLHCDMNCVIWHGMDSQIKIIFVCLLHYILREIFFYSHCAFVLLSIYSLGCCKCAQSILWPRASLVRTQSASQHCRIVIVKSVELLWFREIHLFIVDGTSSCHPHSERKCDEIFRVSFKVLRKMNVSA